MYNSRHVTSGRELSVGARKAKCHPSFSSTLLDDIYRSIDDGSARLPRENDKERDRAEKWIEKAKKKKSGGGLSPVPSVTNKNTLLAVDNNDALFFSSGSDSSKSCFFSDHETIPLPTVKTRSSCFLPPKPKPIRTKTTVAKTEPDHDDHQDGVVPKSTGAKSRALKMYENLMKMKQPVSPGMKLTAFINSILHNSKSKRPTASSDDRSKKPTTTCSAATSFGRSGASYLNQQTTPSCNSVRMDADQRLKLKRDDEILRGSKIQHRKPADDDDEGSSSDCSEDLFEIDHLKLRFELPVYETTAFKTNTSRLSSTTNQSRTSMRGRGRCLKL